MNFIVSSHQLLNHLQAVSKVINPKNNLPILDNFLFKVSDNTLEITGSDLENTLISRFELSYVDGEGVIAVPSKILLDTLKEFPEQPLNFSINPETYVIKFSTESGEYTIMGQPGDDFPRIPELKKDSYNLEIPADTLETGISNTIYAVAEDDYRPVMNGIFFDLKPEHVTFVSSDANRVIRYRRKDLHANEECSFILPKKPANLLKNLLSKEDGNIQIEFDQNNAIFKLSNVTLICRLIEGNYPAYDSVFPESFPYNFIVDRLRFLTTMKRIAIYSNQASNIVNIKLKDNEMTISAQDIDYSISAYERLLCQYSGAEMELVYKSNILSEVLSNLRSQNIIFNLIKPELPAIIQPLESEIEGEEHSILVMPLKTN